MAAPQILSLPAPAPAPQAATVPANPATLARTRQVAAIARERLTEIPGVRVLGSEVAGGAGCLRLVIDISATGRDAREVATIMALRGLPLDCPSERALLAPLGPADVELGTHERLAPALLIALWSVSPHVRSCYP